MTEPTDEPTDEPGATPEQERDVRRLLADARHTEPMPGDVTARLDRVLGELAAGEHAAPVPIADLASHRRRRVTTLLVAAAAVVAVGIGLGQVVPQDSGQDSAATSTESGADADAPAGAGSSASRREVGDSARKERVPQPASTPAYALPAPQKISDRAFSTDVRRVRSRALSQNSAADLSTNAGLGEPDDSATLDLLRGTACTPADWGTGFFVRVRYAGDPGVLVFRRATGDTQVVDLFPCGSAVALRSITLPAP